MRLALLSFALLLACCVYILLTRPGCAEVSATFDAPAEPAR